MGQMTSSSPNSPSLHSSCWLLDWGEAEMAMCHGTRGTTDDIKLSDQTLVSLFQPEIINGKPFAYLKPIYIFETEKQSPTHTIFQSPIKPSVNELFNITAFQCNGWNSVFAAHFKAWNCGYNEAVMQNWGVRAFCLCLSWCAMVSWGIIMM